VISASSRVLQLLSLLQSRRDWSGVDLAERLEIDVRTVRRDVERLRQLGYVIEASSGVGGGYRMGAGKTTPPLLLSDEEVTAVVVALNVTAGTVQNLRETALGVLVKLDPILPSRLRARLRALEATTLTLSSRASPVDWKLLTTIAAACRDQLELEFEYRDRAGKTSQRRVEPLRTAHTGRLWYLVAWDVGKESLRTFRMDRIEPRRLRHGLRFSRRELPEDLATYVSRSLAVAAYRYQVSVELVGSLAELAERIPPWIGLLEALGPRRSRLTLAANSHESLAALLLQLGTPFECLEPQEVAHGLREAVSKLMRSLDGQSTSGVAGLSGCQSEMT
jgi:predicted DNA-binding transcriptional regulator YafY